MPTFEWPWDDTANANNFIDGNSLCIFSDAYNFPFLFVINCETAQACPVARALTLAKRPHNLWCVWEKIRFRRTRTNKIWRNRYLFRYFKKHLHFVCFRFVRIKNDVDEFICLFVGRWLPLRNFLISHWFHFTICIETYFILQTLWRTHNREKGNSVTETRRDLLSHEIHRSLIWKNS